MGGRLPELTLDHDDLGKPGKQVVTPSAAKALTDMMIQVVGRGNRPQRADPGRDRGGQDRHRRAEVDRALPDEHDRHDDDLDDDTDEPRVVQLGLAGRRPTDTDAWFASFAPASHPRVAVGVMFVADGAGGDTAAPAAKGVLEAALQATAP